MTDETTQEIHSLKDLNMETFLPVSIPDNDYREIKVPMHPNYLVYGYICDNPKALLSCTGTYWWNGYRIFRLYNHGTSSENVTGVRY